MCNASFDTPLADWLGDIAELEQNTGNSVAADLYRQRATQARQLQDQADQHDPHLLVELATTKARVLELERRLADAQRALAA